MKCPLCQLELIFDRTYQAESVRYDSYHCPTMAKFKPAIFFSHYTLDVFPALDKHEEWLYLPPYQVIVLESSAVVYLHKQDTRFEYAFTIDNKPDVKDPNKLLERLRVLTPFL